MTIKNIIRFLEEKAALSYQESYDNCGLLTGSENQTCSGVLVCLDSTEEIIDEAIKKNCNLVVAHHPIVFSGLKSITGKNYIERTIIKAIKHDIAIYAIHTNLDNVHYGVNAKISEKLGLINTRVLAPANDKLAKLVFFCPKEHTEKVRKAIFDTGAGVIGNYDQCSFNIEGKGTFRAGESTQAFVGEKGKIHTESETRIEIILPVSYTNMAINALIENHPYEEVAYDIYPLLNKHPRLGSGMIGELKKAMSKSEFLDYLNTTLNCEIIRYTNSSKKEVKKVAVCGGSGSFLLAKSINNEADAFISADFKYHQFFDAENQLMVCDIGHYESEQFTIELLSDWIKEKFPKFAVCLTEINTNPINYFYK